MCDKIKIDELGSTLDEIFKEGIPAEYAFNVYSMEYPKTTPWMKEIQKALFEGKTFIIIDSEASILGDKKRGK